MYIKYLSFIILLLLPISLTHSGEESLLIEVVKSKQTLLSAHNITGFSIKNDPLGRPYLELTLSERGVAEVSRITQALKGETVNIWLGEHPVALSLIIQTAISSSAIRVPVDNMADAQSILRMLDKKGAQ